MIQDNGEYGFPDDEDLSDGPDLADARAAREESRVNTDEIKVTLAESRRLVSGLEEAGKNNHFVQKWQRLIGRAAT